MLKVLELNTFAQLLLSFGLAIALFAFLLFTGASIWKMTFPKFSKLETMVFGFVLSLAILGIGGWLSLEFRIFWIRFLPISAAFVLSVINFSDTWLISKSKLRTSRTTAIGIILGLVAGAPVLFSSLKSQSVNWSGWKVFYPDLDFQISLVGEAGYRTPEFFPYVVGTNLDYHWLFHSTWGIISWAIGLSPAFSTLVFWPIAIWLLIPFVIGLSTFRISGNERAALIAPLLFMISTEAMSWGMPIGGQGGTHSNSPTRDLGAVYFATILLALVEAIRNKGQNNWWRYLGVLSLLSFVGTGTKGPLLVVLTGGFGIWMALERRIIWGWKIFFTMALSGAISVFLVIGESSKVIVGPFATYARNLLFDTLVDKYTLQLVGALVLTSALLTLLPMVYLRTSLKDLESKSIATLLLITSLIALLASKSLDYYGISQEYFWRIASPATVVGVSWAFGIITGKVSTARSTVALSTPIMLSTFVLIATVPDPLDELEFILIFFILPVLSSLLFIYLLRGKKLELGKNPFIYLFGSFIAMHSLIPLLPVAPREVTDSTYGAIHSDAREASFWLKEQGNLDKLFITNQHCRGKTQEGACDARMFFVTAWSGKRSLVEGWAYTPEMAKNYVGGLNKADQELSRQVVTGEIEDQSNLILADSFVNSPTPQTCIEIRNKNVQWVYVDKRLAYSLQLIKFADLKFSSTWAAVYELNC